jgi:F420-non-reducing hydrogenase iron-sulfur subunit
MTSPKPEITVLCCKYCGHVPVELAGKQGNQYPATAKVVDVGCTGSVAEIDLLHALEEGAQGVMVVACPEGNCHHLTGNERAAQRVAWTRSILRSANLGPERIRIVNLGIGHAQAFADAVAEMTEVIGNLDREDADIKGEA